PPHQLPPPPSSTPFPYTTLFRSLAGARLILLSQLGKGKQYRYAQQPSMDAETAAGFLARIVSDARQMAEPHFHGDIELHCSNDLDRKSTRLNSSHVKISYAVFCL